MKRFIVIVLAGIAVALATAGPAQARDRCYRPSYYGHSYSRGYSSGYCAPRYYSSHNYCPPTYYRPYCAPPVYYRSYQPRYYSSPYYSSGIRIGLPGIGISFGRY